MQDAIVITFDRFEVKELHDKLGRKDLNMDLDNFSPMPLTKYFYDGMWVWVIKDGKVGDGSEGYRVLKSTTMQHPNLTIKTINQL